MIVFQQGTSPLESAIFMWSKYNFITFFMCLAFSFNTASYCGSIVREREISFKYLSYVMGMKKSAYWLGTVAFDILIFCLPLAFLFIAIVSFPSEKSQILVNSFGWLALTLIIFSLSFISFTYLWSFAFDKARTAYRFYPFLVFLLFYVIPSIPMYIAPQNTAVHYAQPIISPLLALTSAMMSRQMFGSQNYDVLSQILTGSNALFLQN